MAKRVTRERSKPKRSTRRRVEPAARPPAAPGEDVPPDPSITPSGCQIIGIGASAGGLEALELFLPRVPPDSGLAYVVVTHLDPANKGVLVDLLGRVTDLPVVQVTDRMRVEPDRIYVIPPGKELRVIGGVLRLQPLPTARGHHLPIDVFFGSLAEDQHERAIGVVLSGMGSDGTRGLRAIKEHAGATFVQAPASARYDGMPRSAIDAGVADVVASAEELPGRILAIREHVAPVAGQEEARDEKADEGLEEILALLRTRSGNDFSVYKTSTVYRRIERRMRLHQVDEMSRYARYLRENPKEIDLLFKELLIGVTSFFRDPPTWEILKADILPALLKDRAADDPLRAWVPACSTGEEAYSLAIVFKEVVDRLRPASTCTLQIFATDLDRDAVERARTGVFPSSIAADLSPERLGRHFIQEERGYRVCKEIREMVIFAPQNVTTDPPFTKLDLLSCRNLLIYFSSELQKRLIPLFHYSLKPGGVLVLGSAETVGGFTGLFAPIDGRARIYRRLASGLGAPAVDFPSGFAAVGATPREAAPPGELVAASKPAPNLQALTDRIIVQRFAPACILCSDRGDILYISGRTGRYLEPAAGKANWNVLAMAREGLRYDLSRAFAAAVREDRSVTVRGVQVGTNGATQGVDLTVERLTEPEALRGMVVVILDDVPATPAPRGGKRARDSVDPGRLEALQKELHHTREEAQTMREEMQTSQEELKSTTRSCRAPTRSCRAPTRS